jgi:hypothetical protein
LIGEYLDQPDAFIVADAGGAYSMLGILSDDDIASWTRARRQSITTAPGLVTIEEHGELLGFAVQQMSATGSRALGTPIAVLEVVGVRAADTNEELDAISKVLEAVRATADARLVTSLIELNRSVFVDGMQRAGGRVHGVNNAWIRSLDVGATELEPTVVDDDELLEAARLAFSDYRGHYHVDPRLADVDVTSAYVGALRQHITSGGETWVERDANGVIGFATLEPHVSVNEVLGRAAIVEIGYAGVVPRARRAGAFTRLLSGALRRCAALGFAHVYYGCGAGNIGAQSALVSDGGFRLRRCSLRFHWWLDE